MPKFNGLGERMKFYESQFGENLAYLMPMVPAIIRLDGRAFHSFTKGLDRPFDAGLIQLMVETTKHLVEETNAVLGYTQSDEISLVLYQQEYQSQLYFDGRVSKINSLLASSCSLFFNAKLAEYLPSKVGIQPQFDCRCFSVPNKEEAINAIIWREQDATRNSVQMLGQSKFSHRELQNKNCNEIQEMLFQTHSINWNDLPAQLKRGTYLQRRSVERPFTTEELEKLPPRHEARAKPELSIVRREIAVVDMPILTSVVNKEEVFFDGALPQTL